MSGCCIFHPKFALVLVEGSAKNIKFYKRVLLVRIDWTEEPRIKETEDGEEGDAQGGLPLGEDGEPIDLDTNRCDLVWEGPIKERSYDLFRSKFVESDKVAREFLGEDNQGYWDVRPSCFSYVFTPVASYVFFFFFLLAADVSCILLSHRSLPSLCHLMMLDCLRPCLETLFFFFTRTEDVMVIFAYI